MAIDGIRGIGYLRGPFQRAIYRFKYKGLRRLAVPLAEIMHRYLLENHIPADILMPVPLHGSRLRERGFNQAALLARELGKQSGIPIVEGILVRVRETAPQVGLTASQRRENVKDAFRCADGGVRGKRVLLIDDVCTTGATLEACSLTLREGGAASVWALVLARET